jgi:MFS family permease
MMPDQTTKNQVPASAEKASANILRLGLVSLFNDLGSEVLARLVPLYVTGVLGAPMSVVGAIEGVAESTATLLKPVFGALSDRARKRKPFIIWGYSVSSLARPLLALAGSWPEVGFLRFCDRLGKGMRNAPRDALIADSSLKGQHGRSFGLNRSLDTVGALLGVGAFGAFTYLHGDSTLTAQSWTWICLFCAIPGLISVALVVFGITEVRAEVRAEVLAEVQAAPREVKKEKPASLNPVFKRYLVVVAIFSLANSSDAFILLRARELDYTLPEILGMIALLNIVSALTAIPAAALSDRLGRRTLIAMGWTIYALSYGLLGSPWVTQGRWVFALVVAVYGLFFGFTEGVERAWVADLAPQQARGRAYGVFGLVVGLTALPASLVFGWAWDRFGSAVPFYASSALALLAISMLYALIPITRRAGQDS